MINDHQTDVTWKPRRSIAPAHLIDRLPPHSIEAEQGLLGCLLLESKELNEVVERIDADSFYDLRHQALFELISEMVERGAPVDGETVGIALKEKNQLEALGGYQYLNALLNASPSASNAMYFAGIVSDKATMRKMIATCTEIVARIYIDDNSDQTGDLLDELESKVLTLTRSYKRAKDRTMHELVPMAVTKMEQYHQLQGKPIGLPTGFPDLDKKTKGLQVGLYIIAARPSVGKTSLAMNIVDHIAVDLGLPVGVFSLEMTDDSLVLRLICSRSRINMSNVVDGFLAERDFPRITGAASKLQSAGIHICDKAGLNILQIKSRARRMTQQYGIKLLVVDYLQLVRPARSSSNETRERQVAEISASLKDLSKELRIPVIVLAQLNRGIEKEKNRKPRLSDLRESGAIEQDADFVGLLYRRIIEDEPEENSDCIPVGMVIAKQRDGEQGEIHLNFMKAYTRFESASRLDYDPSAK